MLTTSGALYVIVTGRLQRHRWPVDRLDSLIEVNFTTNAIESYIMHLLNIVGEGGHRCVNMI